MSSIVKKQTASCSVCGGQWYSQICDLETFEKLHDDCSKFFASSVEIVTNLKWSKYDWEQFFSDHLWHINK